MIRDSARLFAGVDLNRLDASSYLSFRYAENLDAPARAETHSDESRGDSGTWGGGLGIGNDAGGSAASGVGGDRERERLLGTLTPVLVSMLSIVGGGAGGGGGHIGGGGSVQGVQWCRGSKLGWEGCLGCGGLLTTCIREIKLVVGGSGVGIVDVLVRWSGRL